MPSEFHFLRPEWLWVLLPLMPLLWWMTRAQDGEGIWRNLVDPHLLSHLIDSGDARPVRTPLLLLATGWVLAVTALAGPVWDQLPQPVYQAQAYRVITLNISPSMNATDVPPSRLARARFEVLDLLRQDTDGQTALIAFGAEPYVVSPLTTDNDTISAQVPELNSALLPLPGEARTDLALQKAGELLRQAGAPNGDVILISDAVPGLDSALNAIRDLADLGYRVSVMGVGTPKGAPVSLPEGGFLKDADGNIRLPKLVEADLQRLARAGGGRYVRSAADDRDVSALAFSPALDVQANEQESVRADRWREEGPWLLLLLLPIAALAFRRGWLSPLLLVAFMLPVPRVEAFEWRDLWQRADQQAAQAFSQGDHEAAANRFERADWRAAARYRGGDYEGTLQALDGLDGPGTDYNRGNSLARLGRFEDALQAYDQTLAGAPAHEDARYNRELVRRLLEQQQQTQNESGQGEQGSESESGRKEADGQSGKSSDGSESKAGEPGEQDQDASSPGSKSDAEADKEGDPAQAGEAPGESEKQGSQRQAATDPGRAGPEAVGEQRPQPGEADLLEPNPAAGEPAGQPLMTSSQAGSTPQSEQEQAMEMMLRRVEDDPSGLLRQRFLLQHLRRAGKLP